MHELRRDDLRFLAMRRSSWHVVEVQVLVFTYGGVESPPLDETPSLAENARQGSRPVMSQKDI